MDLYNTSLLFSLTIQSMSKLNLPTYFNVYRHMLDLLQYLNKENAQ